ncbi:MAG: cytochrome c biogenesis protein CcsA [Sulfurovum sp.]|nr:cytochrome c biogenesis protein CcsA [Sulfurovum sp.]
MKYIFSMKMAVLMLFLFAVIAGGATFIENDYGTQTAQALVYKTRWFEVFLAYFTAIVVYHIFKNKTYKSKPAVALFHFSFLIIAIGAALTRYIGYEGIMHIREGETSNTMVSAEKVLQVVVSDGETQNEFEKILFLSSMSKNSMNETLTLKNAQVEIELLEYLPTVEEKIVPDPKGKTMLEMKVSAGGQGKVHYFSKGDTKDFGSFYIAYEPTKELKDKPVFLIKGEVGALNFDFPFKIKTLNMDTKEPGEIKDGKAALTKRMLFQFGPNAVVLKDIHEKSRLKIFSNSYKTQSSMPEFIKLKVSVGDESKIIDFKPFSGRTGGLEKFTLGGVDINMRLGAKIIDVPFSIKLEKFTMDRYPGSMTPAAYSSDVVLIDKEEDINMPYKIFMNHVLDHRNYRFFQSSYDPDEKGTVLSVNHDPGTWPTYIGYILMTLGMLWSLFAPSGRFVKLLKKTRKLQSAAVSVMFIALLSSMPNNLQAATPTASAELTKIIENYDVEHAKNFGKLAVQDPRGRMKPMDTMAHEMISKITGRTSVLGLNPNQVLLGMITNPAKYQEVEMIKIGHEKIALDIGLPKETKFAKFSDFFTKESSYKIYDAIVESGRKKPLEQSKYDKELLKVDERVNVAFMAYQGSILRIYPKPNDVNNKWMAPMDALKTFPKEEASEVKISISAYFQMVEKGLSTGNWADANLALKGLHKIQKKYGSEVLPSQSHVAMEIWYNKLGLFSKLVPLYLFMGLILLVFAFINVLKPNFPMKRIMQGAWAILLIGFALHIIGLVLRWYVAGHAPWSNAYESIVVIAASTVLAGILLARRSPFALAGTAILAGITMGVAHMNFINPEITTLVPVLNSYWLMIHVATIISGDGFFGLGFILSFLVLILYVMRGKEGHENIDRAIKELTNLSEMSLIIGIFIFTIGNFLGGVWANESWGRYWGWDAKETWAAVTILVYATVLHLRFVPSLKSNFVFNMATTWAYFSVIMTYFGVNYYLSGLHSYAAGDPVPIPMWVYYAVASLFVLTVLAARNRKLS